jgi:hypothetical protein
VIVAGIAAGFVGPALACNGRNRVAIAAVDDQRVRAAAAETKLVLRADRKALGPTQPVEVSIVNTISMWNGASAEILTTTTAPGGIAVGSSVSGMLR